MHEKTAYPCHKHFLEIRINYNIETLLQYPRDLFPLGSLNCIHIFRKKKNRIPFFLSMINSYFQFDLNFVTHLLFDFLFLYFFLLELRKLRMNNTTKIHCNAGL